MSRRLSSAFLSALTLALAVSATAGSTFRIELGPAFAANVPGMKKGTAFAARAVACDAPEGPRVTATAHTFVNGSRQTSPLSLAALDAPGAFAVPFPAWPRGASGVVTLEGTCGSARTGAVVTLRPSGFSRDASRHIDRAPADADVSAALAALTATATR